MKCFTFKSIRGLGLAIFLSVANFAFSKAEANPYTSPYLSHDGFSNVETTRRPVSLNESIPEIIQKLSEGDLRVTSVLRSALRLPEGFAILGHLDDMNMRGVQIWTAFHDYSLENLERFVKSVSHREPEMIGLVNSTLSKQGFNEVAIPSGFTSSEFNCSPMADLGRRPGR